jgi:glycosyltransferase involved in cell wall biosynthesis
VTIVAATQSHIRTHNPNFKKKITEEYIDGIKYIWIKTHRYIGNGIKRVFNMLDYIKTVYAIMPRLVNENPDVVIASSTYPLDNYPVYRLAKKTKAKYVYEVHDLWPLSPMELGGYSKYHPFIMVMQMAENFACKHVDKAVSILPCAEQHMVEHGLGANKFHHIPNGISLEEKKGVEPLDEKIKALIPKNKFIIGYAGTFGLANSLETIFFAASIIKEQFPEIFFVLIGNGPERDSLITLQKELRLVNMIVVETIPKRQIQSALEIFDVCIITSHKQSLYRFGISPNKIFDYMYASKPVIQAIEAGNDIVADANCGITVEPENPQAIADGILKLYNMSKNKREILGNNGKQFVLKNYTYNDLARRFLEAII